MLDWQDNNSRDGFEQAAIYRGLRIRAVQDTCPENPLETHDGHWPMRVYHVPLDLRPALLEAV